MRIKKRKQFDPNAKGSKRITERTESRYKDKKEEMEDEELIITREVLQKLQRRNEAEVLPFVKFSRPTGKRANDAKSYSARFNS